MAALVVAAVSVSAAGSSTPIKRVAPDRRQRERQGDEPPGGITCPRTCRNLFPKDGRVRLTSRIRPRAGASLAGRGYCKGKTATCAFYLTTGHECSSKLCAAGAFGVQVVFVKQT